MGRSSTGVVFVGGGTGGHLYPALAIIEQLKEIDPDIKTHVVCSERRIDSAILESEGAVFSTIPAVSPSGGVKGYARFVLRWGPSVRGVRSVIREMKNDCDRVVVVSMGGFVSAPSAMSARAEKCELVLVNLDAVPGRANRWIGKRADRAFTAARVVGDDARFASWVQTRPIVRGFAGRRGLERANAEFGLEQGLKTLLVTGGSQGARSVNRFMVEMARRHSDAFAGWQVLHQVGGGDNGEAVAIGYRDAGVQAVVVEYIEEMGAALKIADCAVGRCGAGTVAECWAAGVPAVFLPYPYHADEHQKHNAAVLVEAGGAVVCDDRIDPEKNIEAHGGMLDGLLKDGDRLGSMRAALVGLGPADGAAEIARSLVGD
ncbi:MAG: UDP-N-acetylglucosamine--N-acetylmuramyl-(pentapeptide) pyrophosphoryl-undecaprenol N-acetylglucosamine transferase [Phycisphaerales bacterium]|nr:UDP-N-acetylglucosamine--N-acetylmuramyl-(pentapeptide) pyrophosphoryl-undecaprenol N-acetylglucosamine transferase [Phycisphaerales bacterium]